MNDKIEKLKEERNSIIHGFSSKKPEDTMIDKLAKTNDLQYVTIKEIITETKDTKSFILVPDIKKGTSKLKMFMPGQYISLKMFADETYTTRAYTLSSSPKEALQGFYRITIKRVQNGLISNLLLDHLKVGDGLTISNPVGDFHYSSIRDEENVIGVAGGSGITPFISLAKDIIDGNTNCHLTVFYSVRTEEDIILRKEIEKLKRSKKVNFQVILTREEKPGYLYGHIKKEMIEPYIKEFNTFFMCGPVGLYKSMNEILTYFEIPRKNVHFENYYNFYEPKEEKDFELKIITEDTTKIIPCSSTKTLLVAMEEAGFKAPSLCRVGTCGFCKSILLEGHVKMIGSSMPRDLALNDYIHPCISYPDSDVTIRVSL